MKNILFFVFILSSFSFAQDLPHSGVTVYKEFIEIVPKFDAAFTAEEEEFLEKAIDILQDRLLKMRVELCSMRNRRITKLVPDYWTETNWTEAEGARQYTLGFQLAFFRRNPTGKPIKLDIRAFHEKEGAYAMAPTGIIKTVMKNGSVDRATGTFLIRLNRWWLLSNSDEGKNVDFWAATLAHEMLHNIGHRHEKVNYDGHEIIAFDKCIETDGYLNTESGSGTDAKITVNSKTGKKILRRSEVCDTKKK